MNVFISKCESALIKKSGCRERVITISSKSCEGYTDVEYAIFLEDLISSLSGTANILFIDSDDNDGTLLKVLRKTLSYVNRNKEISDVSLTISSSDYEHTYNKICNIIYSGMTNYNIKHINRIIFGCRVIKIIGKKNAKKIYFIYRILAKIKRKVLL